MPETNIAAVTFDAYNTLLDFAAGSVEQVEAMFRAAGIDVEHDVKMSALKVMNDTVMERLGAFVNVPRDAFDGFVRMHDIHTDMFTRIERDLINGLDVDAITGEWNKYIARVPLYDDARGAVEWSAERWPVAIVSDIDTWMLAENPNVADLPVRGMVTSEGDASYKAMTDCTMFQAAADMLGCEPSQIVHVGDSGADVIGVKRAGGKAVWLDRFGHSLHSDIPEPDATITTLADLPRAVEALLANGR